MHRNPSTCALVCASLLACVAVRADVLRYGGAAGDATDYVLSMHGSGTVVLGETYEVDFDADTVFTRRIDAITDDVLTSILHVPSQSLPVFAGGGEEMVPVAEAENRISHTRAGEIKESSTFGMYSMLSYPQPIDISLLLAPVVVMRLPDEPAKEGLEWKDTLKAPVRGAPEPFEFARSYRITGISAEPNPRVDIEVAIQVSNVMRVASYSSLVRNESEMKGVMQFDPVAGKIVGGKGEVTTTVRSWFVEAGVTKAPERPADGSADVRTEFELRPAQTAPAQPAGTANTPQPADDEGAPQG